MLLDAIFAPDRLPGRGNPLPRPLFLLLGATFAAFFAGATFNSLFTTASNILKWLPLIALGAFALLQLRKRPVPTAPKPMLFLVSALLLVCFFGLFGAGDRVKSALTLATVAGVIVISYFVSATLVATNSRRAFFTLVAMFGRVIILGSALFLVAGISLGRGSEFSAWTDNPNTLASMIAPGVTVMIAGCIERRGAWLVWHLPFVVVGTALLFISNGRASVVWIAAAALTFMIYRRGPLLNTFLALFAALVLIIFWDPITTNVAHYLQLDSNPYRERVVGPLSGREEVWRIGWELFLQRPLLGYGTGSSVELVISESWRFVRMQGAHFHSSYVTVLVENGLLGFIPFILALGYTVAQGIGDAARTRALPKQSWPTAALPLAMVLGAMGHGAFESWLTAAGNLNSPLLWICVWLVHHQTQVPVRVNRQTPARPPRGFALAGQ